MTVKSGNGSIRHWYIRSRSMVGPFSLSLSYPFPDRITHDNSRWTFSFCLHQRYWSSSLYNKSYPSPPPSTLLLSLMQTFLSIHCNGTVCNLLSTSTIPYPRKLLTMYTYYNPLIHFNNPHHTFSSHFNLLLSKPLNAVNHKRDSNGREEGGGVSIVFIVFVHTSYVLPLFLLLEWKS